MPANGMNIGTDYTFSFYDGTTGELVTLGDVESVSITALKHDLKSMPYNNYPRYAFVDDGFKIEFAITRGSSTLEDMMVKLSQNLINGQVQKPGYFNETVINPDGSTSRYQYGNFVAFLTDHGNVSRDKVVKLKLEGMASYKAQIA